jgi:hypothetical protein
MLRSRVCRLAVLMVAVAVPATSQVPAPPSADIRSAAFLAGCWRLERPGLPAEARIVDEQWMAPAGGLMLGMSRTVSRGRATEYEFTRLEARDGRLLVLVAQPSGQPSAEFRAVEVGEGVLVFENPLHDFPQRVEYRRVGPARLDARIEGTVQGRARAVDFPYVRVACE